MTPVEEDRKWIVIQKYSIELANQTLPTNIESCVISKLTEVKSLLALSLSPKGTIKASEARIQLTLQRRLPKIPCKHLKSIEMRVESQMLTDRTGLAGSNKQTTDRQTTF